MTLLAAPNVLIAETRSGLVVTAEVPGLTEDDLDITLSGDRLAIEGRRVAERHPEGASYLAMERSAGFFRRSFAVPGGVGAIDTERISADLKDGVLRIELPRRANRAAWKISLSRLVEWLKQALAPAERPGNRSTVQGDQRRS